MYKAMLHLPFALHLSLKPNVYRLRRIVQALRVYQTLLWAG